MRRIAMIAVWLAAATTAVAQDRPEVWADRFDWEAVGRLDLGAHGFCTGTLIAPDLVLTAAHCLYDRQSGDEIDAQDIEFQAGWRFGRALAYRQVTGSVTHPGFDYASVEREARIRHDLALLFLDAPVEASNLAPFAIAPPPMRNARVGIIAYGLRDTETPALQSLCRLLAVEDGVVITSCSADFGTSGAPVLSFEGGVARIVSVVSARAELDGGPVALGMVLDDALPDLLRLARARLAE